jgi:hypothetical protein
MKALPYLNLSTHMGPWAGVMLEGDIEVNCLHGLFLKFQLNLHALRTNVSYEPCLLLCFVLDGLDMVLLGMSWACTQDMCLHCRTLAHVMESRGSSSN